MSAITVGWFERLMALVIFAASCVALYDTWRMFGSTGTWFFAPWMVLLAIAGIGFAVALLRGEV